ncbi:MAG: hypothetical protein KKD28_03965 [Chloroflexi bacterium]|nr:hypothetical protein [Chloroflexota bacterium]
MPAVAQDEQPPTPESPFPFKDEDHGAYPDGPRRGPEGEWYMPAGLTPVQGNEPQSVESTGGPDDFGYTWDDSVALNWIDASGGTEAGIKSSTDHVGPINIGFPFKYYENTRTELYISRFGFVAFNDTSLYNSQSQIPSPETPNDVIAPHWVPAYNVNGYVRYLSGGTAPNRWFVVEWNRLESDCCGDEAAEEYTFEVVLHENSDIVFQYGTMTVDGGYYCQASGIEDSTGLDGLSITDFCEQIAPNHTVRFYRPPVSARVQMRPSYQGTFTHAGETLTYELTVRNTGELGADTYDLAVASTWPVTLYGANGAALTDTNGNGTVDTGAIAQGGSMTIIAKVQTPTVANIADDNQATVTSTSSLNPAKSKTATLQAAIPAPFAQAYSDQADGAMSLYLVKPDSQVVKKATSDDYYGCSMAVAETPGFVYTWSNSQWLGDFGIRDIEYTLLDDNGSTTRGVTKLTDNSGATMRTYDYDPAVAVAPNGNIGVLWYRYLYNDATSQQNYNIWFAVLDPSGNPLIAPVNITNNNSWGSWGDIGYSQLYDQRITATDDNHFMLAWERYSYESAGNLADIYYAIRNSNGSEIKPATKYTNGVAGTDYYDTPALTKLNSNKALLVYEGPSCFSYVVLDSAGNTVKSETVIGPCGGMVDAVQYSTGNAIIVWSGYGGIEYVVLDSAHNMIAGPTMLNNPAAFTDDDYVSVTADQSGNAILTWMDGDWNMRRNLYYALVDSSGNVLTQPMIFRTAEVSSWGDQYIETSYEGYGNTSYTIPATSSQVDTAIKSKDRVGALAGGAAAIPVMFDNQGLTTATGVQVTATLDPNLTYLSDTSGVTPAVNGSTVTWNFPTALDFLGRGEFTLQVGVPVAPKGTAYPVTLVIASAEADANPADNTASVEVLIDYRVYLPVIMNNYHSTSCYTRPTLISPVDGSALDTIAPLYEWDNGNQSNVDYGRLQVATDADFANTVTSLWYGGAMGTMTFRFAHNLDPATTYYWRAWLVCEDGIEGPYSETWSFTTGSGGVVLPTPTLTAPADGSMLDSWPVTLEWDPVAGAVGYLVRWREAGSGGYSYTWISETQLELSWLNANTTYEWWVSARNDYAIGTDSAMWQFTTPPTVSAAVQQAPEHYFIVEGDAVTTLTGAELRQQSAPAIP